MDDSKLKNLESVKVVKNPFVDQDFYGQDKKI